VLFVEIFLHPLGVPPKWSAARIRLQFERILVVPTEENRINFDWLQGYVTALEGANRMWR